MIGTASRGRQYLGGPLDGLDTGPARSIYRLEDGSPCTANHGDRRTHHGRWRPGETGIYARTWISVAAGQAYRWVAAPPAESGPGPADSNKRKERTP